MAKTPPNLLSVVFKISSLLDQGQYAFRGTTSLILQNFDMVALDIDILADKKTSLETNIIMKDYLVKKVEYSESDKFRSYFGEFNVDGVKVEVMGDWQIKTPKGVWSKTFDAAKRIPIEISGNKVYVTSVEEELEVFALMGRWNAYQKIKRQINASNQPSLF